MFENKTKDWKTEKKNATLEHVKIFFLLARNIDGDVHISSEVHNSDQKEKQETDGQPPEKNGRVHHSPHKI